jgi:pyridine nucleotide-disulfide oxidoreductase family protein
MNNFFDLTGKPHLVLLGGGHSHAIFLKLWAKNPRPNVRVSLVSDVVFTPYSGMLPGYIAGFYSYQETHINLQNLAKFAGVNFYLDKALNLDLVNKRIILANYNPIYFDFLAINIGSTPNRQGVKGANNYAIPLKPVPQFLTIWEKILTKINSLSCLKITIVGGGAGGVELALNIYAKLFPLIPNLTINLVHNSSRLLPNHNQFVSNILESLLLEKKVNLYLGERVIEVEKNKVVCDSGLIINSDYIFWVTNASAPEWVQNCGLITDENGFIIVNNYLQSISHSDIFATGDIATIQNYPRPKAGVFAVRQGPPLFNNLSRILSNQNLIPYYPQSSYLSLIGTGDKRAIASWGNLAFYSPFFWCLKDSIDRHFMGNFDPN